MKIKLAFVSSLPILILFVLPVFCIAQSDSENTGKSTTDPTDPFQKPFVAPAGSLPIEAPKNATILLNSKVNRFLGRTGGKIDWPLKDGVITSTRGQSRNNHILSSVHFRDADIHVEFKLPEKGPGNSGIYIHGNYEMQILRPPASGKPTMNDIGALYGFQKALTQAGLPPGKWQSYDIRYQAPRRNDKQEIIQPGKITAYLNGKLVQKETTFTEPRSKFHPFRRNPTKYLKELGQRQKQTSIGPLFLQDHDNPVQFRNIWIIPKGPKQVTRSGPAKKPQK